jgi:hypothetical protein
MTVKRIVPNLASADPTGTADFYTSVLGLKVAMDMGWIITLTSAAVPSAQLSLLRHHPGQPHPDYTVEVTDLEDCHRRALAASYEVVYPLTDEPWGVRRFRSQRQNRQRHEALVTALLTISSPALPALIAAGERASMRFLRGQHRDPHTRRAYAVRRRIF